MHFVLHCHLSRAARMDNAMTSFSSMSLKCSEIFCVDRNTVMTETCHLHLQFTRSLSPMVMTLYCSLFNTFHDMSYTHAYFTWCDVFKNFWVLSCDSHCLLFSLQMEVMCYVQLVRMRQQLVGRHGRSRVKRRASSCCHQRHGNRWRWMLSLQCWAALRLSLWLPGALTLHHLFLQHRLQPRMFAWTHSHEWMFFNCRIRLHIAWLLLYIQSEYLFDFTASVLIILTISLELKFEYILSLLLVRFNHFFFVNASHVNYIYCYIFQFCYKKQMPIKTYAEWGLNTLYR